MYNPLLSRPYGVTQILPDNDQGETEQPAFEDVMDDASIIEATTISDFDIKVIADKISTKLAKLVEEQLQEPVKE